MVCVVDAEEDERGEEERGRVCVGECMYWYIWACVAYACVGHLGEGIILQNFSF